LHRFRSAGVIAVLVLAALALALLIPSPLLWGRLPSRDSGVFLYTGWRILDGDLPYRDVWDHKPPAVYYVNALGLLLGGGAEQGVWALELTGLLAATLLGFALLRRAFGFGAACFGSAIWLLSLTFVLQRGNFTEEYALPCQFLALWLFQHSELRGRRAWTGIALGAAVGLAFLLRQNLAGVGLAVGAYWLIAGFGAAWRTRLRSAGQLALGALAVVALCVLFFAAQGALVDFWDAAFRYNFLYVHATWARRWQAISEGLSLMYPSGLNKIALVGWVLGALAVAVPRCRRAMAPAARTLIAVALLALPIELALAAASGRSYQHYFIAWLPAFAVLAGAFVFVVSMGVERLVRRLRWAAFLRLWPYVLLANLSIFPLGMIALDVRFAAIPTNAGELAGYINETTRPEDYVLMWGAQAAYNFRSRRRSPTRFVHQIPFYVSAYRTPENVAALLRDIERNKPIFIVDTSCPEDTVPPLDPAEREAWTNHANTAARKALVRDLQRVLDYVHTNYERTTPNARPGWPVYRRRDDADLVDSKSGDAICIVRRRRGRESVSTTGLRSRCSGNETLHFTMWIRATVIRGTATRIMRGRFVLLR